MQSEELFRPAAECMSTAVEVRRCQDADGYVGRVRSLRACNKHALLAEGRTSGCRLRAPARVLGRVEHWIEDLEPALDRLIAARRHDHKIAGACCRNVGDPDRFGAIALHRQVARFPELDRRRATERLQPQGACHIDVPVRLLAGKRARRIREDHDREFQSSPARLRSPPRRSALR